MVDLQRSLSTSSSSTYSFSSQWGDSYPLSMDSELWLMAEQRAQEILSIIQPTLASEKKRKEVIDYIRRLIHGSYATEVFPFGSVPLKTYLPDGDVDLAAFSYQTSGHDLAQDVCNFLSCQVQDSEFQVKDVQYVPAQVKIVKCSVKDIPVDISFNQMAGLCALCFLEQIDQVIGKGHLLKQSIILIKAWCFYESRILGAYHGLMSTYALEILVLHVINLFHSSLPGPLAVLHRFLEYYSTFDWDKYCVSITGRVPLSSHPEIAAELQENNGNELLLSHEFLRKCRETFSVPIRAVDNGRHEFPLKHLNIVDPLKYGNNLGRSVSRGNFNRIKCALSYGSQKLREILMLPGESMVAGLERFFMNTLDQNGKGERRDALVPVLAFGTGRSEAIDLNGDYDKYYSNLLHGQCYVTYTLSLPTQPSPPSSPSPFQQLSQFRHNILSQRGTDVFIPRVSLCQPYFWQPYATNAGTDGMARSRGTNASTDGMARSRGRGAYFPPKNHPFKDLPPRMWSRKLNSQSHRMWPHKDLPDSLKSSRKTDQVEYFQEIIKSGSSNCLNPCNDQFTPELDKSRNDSCFNLSLDQFPPLSPIEKSPLPEIHQSSKPLRNSPQVEDPSCHNGIIQFGVFKHSLLLSELPSKQDTEISTTVMEMTKNRQQKQQELLETRDKKILRQQYQLKSDEDFPPLSL